MQRFISHEALARDKRFIREQTPGPQFRGMPDEVEAVVAAFEAAAPQTEARIRGTKLQQIYDEVGPGFQILMQLGKLGADAESSRAQMAARLHAILVGEIQALEAAGRTLWDFPELEWGFKMNMARQCWDEARHVQIYEKLLQKEGGEIGDYPENTFLFETGCADDPVLRVTGVNRCLEGLACDVFRDLIETGKQTGDAVLAQSVDYVLADELTHVRFGSDWSKECTKDDPERRRRTKEFQRETERAFAFSGRRHLAHADRLQAGFSSEELAELEGILKEVRESGPRGATLIAAAERMRERHLARKRGEHVPRS